MQFRELLGISLCNKTDGIYNGHRRFQIKNVPFPFQPIHFSIDQIYKSLNLFSTKSAFFPFQLIHFSAKIKISIIINIIYLGSISLLGYRRRYIFSAAVKSTAQCTVHTHTGCCWKGHLFRLLPPRVPVDTQSLTS